MLANFNRTAAAKCLRAQPKVVANLASMSTAARPAPIEKPEIKYTGVSHFTISLELMKNFLSKFTYSLKLSKLRHTQNTDKIVDNYETSDIFLNKIFSFILHL
jgi:hypothetical protein